MKRNAFTLIELLIVIAIIGVLLGLIVAYLSGAFGQGKATQTFVEVASLEAAVKKFHADHGFNPPSKFVICRNFQRVQTMDAASAGFWTKMYPYMTMIGSNAAFPVQGSDWANVSQAMVPYLPPVTNPSQPPVTLTSDQCLVFFLSGFQGQGLSPNPKDPTDFNGLTGKKYFEFDSRRLVPIVVSGKPFPGFADPYGTRYAYFSHAGQSAQLWRATDAAGVQPYYKQSGANRTYYKDFQIISAGADNTFGPGGDYDQASPATTPQGYDDIANFRGKKIGVP